MRLEAVKVTNFRSLRETDWIKVSDLIAFIGQNDGGKTACTDAIGLLLERSARPDEGDFSWEPISGQESHCRAESIVVEAKLTVQEKDKDRVQEALGADATEIHIKRTFILNGGTRFGSPRQQRKRTLILDREPYRYQKFISDIAGQDIKSHDGDPKLAIRQVRNWLSSSPTMADVMVPGPGRIVERYQLFRDELPELCRRVRLNPDGLIFKDFTTCVSE